MQIWYIHVVTVYQVGEIVFCLMEAVALQKLLVIRWIVRKINGWRMFETVNKYTLAFMSGIGVLARSAHDRHAPL